MCPKSSPPLCRSLRVRTCAPSSGGERQTPGGPTRRMMSQTWEEKKDGSAAWPHHILPFSPRWKTAQWSVCTLTRDTRARGTHHLLCACCHHLKGLPDGEFFQRSFKAFPAFKGVCLSNLPVDTRLVLYHYYQRTANSNTLSVGSIDTGYSDYIKKISILLNSCLQLLKIPHTTLKIPLIPLGIFLLPFCGFTENRDLNHCVSCQIK